jgi:hypothetical protein
MSEMKTQWYIRRDGVIHGPASAADLKNLLETKRITLQQEAGQAKEGPWRSLSDYAEFAPVRPIAELFGADGTSPALPPIVKHSPARRKEPSEQRDAPQTNISPTALRLLAEAFDGDGGTLPISARIEFMDGLVAEARKDIDGKTGYWAFPAGLIVFVILAAVNLPLAFISAFIASGIAWKAAQSVYEKKYLDPIADYSDEMMVARYNEVKADRRAAGTRTAIWRAVLLIVVVLLLIGWLAARR